MTISLVVLFGVALFVCLAKDNMSKVHALIAVLFGLYLGSSGAGPAIKSGTENFFNWLSHINF